MKQYKLLYIGILDVDKEGKITNIEVVGNTETREVPEYGGLVKDPIRILTFENPQSPEEEIIQELNTEHVYARFKWEKGDLTWIICQAQ